MFSKSKRIAFADSKRFFFLIRQHILEKSFRPATLTVDMEYTPLPVIDVSQSKPQEDFNRNYSSRIQNAHPDEGNHQNEQNQMAVMTKEVKIFRCKFLSSL